MRVDNLNEELTKEILEEFAEFVDQLQYPSSWSDLLDLLAVQDFKMKERLDRILVATDYAAHFKFNAEVQKQLDRAREKNETSARELCKKTLGEMVSWVLAKHRVGGYHKASGLEDLHKDLESVKAAYDKKPELKRIRFYATKERKAFWNKEVQRED